MCRNVRSAARRRCGRAKEVWDAEGPEEGLERREEKRERREKRSQNERRWFVSSCSSSNSCCCSSAAPSAPSVRRFPSLPVALSTLTVLPSASPTPSAHSIPLHCALHRPTAPRTAASTTTMKPRSEASPRRRRSVAGRERSRRASIRASRDRMGWVRKFGRGCDGRKVERKVESGRGRGGGGRGEGGGRRVSIVSGRRVSVVPEGMRCLKRVSCERGAGERKLEGRSTTGYSTS